jgi:hypothetical protein
VARKAPVVSRTIPALKVSQWLSEWDEVTFDKEVFQDRPETAFYLLSLPASHLKALTGVYRRSTKKRQPRAKDPNVQRGHEEERSATIREFVKYGFPWCEMGGAKRRTPDAQSLRKPGWLPTAIIVNILAEGDKRDGQTIANKDLVSVVDKGRTASIELPSAFSGQGWEPETIFPLEVIDGQHRLWAFEDFEPDGDFDLPSVAFHALDRSWQAYLFWSVNITPKRINRSLAFDLYPLLRQEDWLDKFSGHSIYRETRCQELVEALWSHPESPWHDRINMLGETAKQLGTDVQMVTQAAWIRSLMASFVKEWGEGGDRIGGLFGAARAKDALTLPWTRAMQAGFLIAAGQALRDGIKRSKSEWAFELRSLDGAGRSTSGPDPAFVGKYSLLASDQGIRGWLQVTNDLCYVSSSDLNLDQWTSESIYTRRNAKAAGATDEGAVTLALKSVMDSKIGGFLSALGGAFGTYDWRTSSTPGLSESERLRQAVFRGGSGYREMRRQLLLHLTKGSGAVARAATKVATGLGYK